MINTKAMLPRAMLTSTPKQHSKQSKVKVLNKIIKNNHQFKKSSECRCCVCGEEQARRGERDDRQLQTKEGLANQLARAKKKNSALNAVVDNNLNSKKKKNE
ncbi:hypothetical protein CAOG_009289 [Capsaspora owczarzaki ATCC 30864]|uniref:Uncharacterized protein n=1 Tax=Capsaspora owczarzaki (strain ATCC 30864) TaxID=595528 RepID=A0A0D2WGL2_CAPO3|nr:hypothetical protein CAOG_009289 [Capsaspora owczarzaki ATCC 30864]